MPRSIFKEVAFTPQSFENKFIMANKRRFGKLIAILESLIDSGVIVAASTQWRKKVFEFIQEYDENDKDELASLLKEIDSRNRIAVYPDNGVLDKELSWIDLFSKLDSIRAFEFIAGSKNENVVRTIESIEREHYQNSGAIVETQTEENMEAILAPVLGYAEDTTIIDPYFNLAKSRYMEALNIIAKTFGKRHDKRESMQITIQSSIKTILDKSGYVDLDMAKKWPELLHRAEKKYGHTIIINIWEDLKEDKWHDRWLITNQCGITMGKGSDISEWTDATWGLLDWNEIPDIANKFNGNRQIYNHILTIDSDGIKKINKVKKYPYAKQVSQIEAVKNAPTQMTKSGIRKKVL